jgi:Domain of unknown function (DUF6265)
MGRVAVAVSATFLVLLRLVPLAHTTDSPVPAHQASAPAVNKPATLADLAWLEGGWRGDWGPRVAEQVWMSPRAGLMVGTFRLVEDGKTLLIELFTFLEKRGGIEFRFRHFTPELAPWEKSDATLLTLESFDAKRFVFVNPLNGQPKHAIFTRLDPDSYVSRSEILPENGGLQVIEITYRRERPGPSVAAAARH